MTTQINVIVDNGGLSTKAKQQTTANRWQRSERDQQAKAREQLNAAASGSPQPTIRTMAVTRKSDEPAATRLGAEKYLKLLPPSLLISEPDGWIPPESLAGYPLRFWANDYKGFTEVTPGLEAIPSTPPDDPDNERKLFALAGDRISLDISGLPTLSQNPFDPTVLIDGSIEILFRLPDTPPSEIALSATFVAPLSAGNTNSYSRSEARTRVVLTQAFYPYREIISIVTDAGEAITHGAAGRRTPGFSPHYSISEPVAAGQVGTVSITITASKAVITINNEAHEFPEAITMPSGEMRLQVYTIGISYRNVGDPDLFPDAPFAPPPSSAGAVGSIRLSYKA